jgi:hypothetical protein
MSKKSGKNYRSQHIMNMKELAEYVEQIQQSIDDDDLKMVDS